MSEPARILAFCGSLREGSYNQALLHLATALATGPDVELTTLTLAHFPAPLYNANIQNTSGIPIPIHQLRTRIAAADALLIATPEYNGGYTPLIKNTIDWLSRLDRNVFAPHLIGLLTASPGGHAGSTNRAQLTSVLTKMRATMHESFGLPKMRENLIDGDLVDADLLAELERWTAGFVAAAITHAHNPPTLPEPDRTGPVATR